MNLVTTDWLESNLDRVKIFDASWHMPSSKRDAKKEYEEKHIRGAMFWDVDEHSDKDSSVPHMLPNSDYWTRMMWSFGIKNSDHIVVYDFSDVYSSCRLWFSLKYFGHEKVSVLDGGLQKWLKEKKPTTNKLFKIKKGNFTSKINKDYRLRYSKAYTLYSLQLNIEIGQKLLKRLINNSNSKNSILDALIAYNAGITRLKKWRKDIGNIEPIVFIESIPIKETRWFVKYILTDLWSLLEKNFCYKKNKFELMQNNRYLLMFCLPINI